ncbi:TPA: VENN motif pre-toxin domain-containing protein [Serratia liquefaciens]
MVIRDRANQQQDVNALSRDTDNANGSIGAIFDKEKEQNRLKQAQLIGEIAGQTMDIVRTQGDINGLQKAKDKHPGLDAKALRKTPEYQAEMQKYGTGSDMQRAAQAVTGALQALAGNNLAGALASGAAPYLAKEIKARVGENNVAANAMAHALLGAITAQLNNQSAVAGAVGAGGGELAARVVVEIRFPGRDINSLSEGEKQEVSALSQLAAGLAGGIASDSTAGAVAASQAGKNAVENNFLSAKDVLNLHKELEAADKTGADKPDIYEKYAEVSKKNREEAVAEGCSGNPFCANGALSEAGAGSDIANSLKRLPVFSNLSSDDLAQLDRFVLAENEDSARAIYQAMPDYVKVALNGKEAVEAIGLGAAVGGKALAALGVIGKAGKQPYEPNKGAVGNMGEFFKQAGFGEATKGNSQKTSKIYQGQTVYKASSDVSENIRKGDQFYLDGEHKNHLEVFDKRNKFVHVLNLDGSINIDKTKKASAEGRTLPK